MKRTAVRPVAILMVRGTRYLIRILPGRLILDGEEVCYLVDHETPGIDITMACPTEWVGQAVIEAMRGEDDGRF